MRPPAQGVGGGRGGRRRALSAGGEEARFGRGAGGKNFLAAFAALRTLAGDWLRRALRGVEVGAGVEAADPYNADIALKLCEIYPELLCLVR